MTRTCFPRWFRLDHRDRYLIWFEGEHINDVDDDGVVTDANGRVPVLDSPERLRAYASAHAIPVEDQERLLHNLDTVVVWLRRKRSQWTGPTALDCNATLAAWNLFADVSRTIDGGFDPDREATNMIYDKLFWGTNPPALTPAGKHYTPFWPAAQQRLLRATLRHGLQMFRRATRRTTAP